MRPTDPPTVVNHTSSHREVVVDRDPPVGLIAAICGVVLLVAGLIGYYAYWSPNNRTEVVVEQPVGTDGRAQPMQSPQPPTIITPPPVINTQPPVVNQPPIIVNPPNNNEEKTVIIEREKETERTQEQVPPPDTSGTEPPVETTTGGN